MEKAMKAVWTMLGTGLYLEETNMFLDVRRQA